MSDTRKDSTQLNNSGAEVAVASSGVAVALIWGVGGIVLFVLSILHGVKRMNRLDGNAWNVVCAILFPGAYSIVAGVADYGSKGALAPVQQQAEELIRSMQF